MEVMASPLDTRRLLRESAPVAVILLFWVVLASFVPAEIATGLMRAGIIMAVLYTIVRGLAIAETLEPARLPTDVEGILRENVRVAIPAGSWFLAAHAIYLVEQLWDMLGIPGWDTSPAGEISFVFVGTGVAAVLLYAISVGVPRVRGIESTRGDNSPEGLPADY